MHIAWSMHGRAGAPLITACRLSPDIRSISCGVLNVSRLTGSTLQYIVELHGSVASS